MFKMKLLNWPKTTRPSSFTCKNCSDWPNGVKKTEKSRRIWEPTYTLIYENPLENNRISESVKLSDMKKDEYENILEINDKSVVKQALNVIKLLNEFCNKYDLIVPNDVFYSSKLTQKLTQGLTDSLIVAARSLPLWCDQLVFDYSCLFAVETRQMHLRATAFGTSRAIVWLQNRRDQILEQNRSSNSSIPDRIWPAPDAKTTIRNIELVE